MTRLAVVDPVLERRASARDQTGAAPVATLLRAGTRPGAISTANPTRPRAWRKHQEQSPDPAARTPTQRGVRPMDPTSADSTKSEGGDNQSQDTTITPLVTHAMNRSQTCTYRVPIGWHPAAMCADLAKACGLHNLGRVCEAPCYEPPARSRKLGAPQANRAGGTRAPSREDISSRTIMKKGA